MGVMPVGAISSCAAAVSAPWFHCEPRRDVLEREFSTELLADYIESADLSNNPTRFDLKMRFPQSQWGSARAALMASPQSKSAHVK